MAERETITNDEVIRPLVTCRFLFQTAKEHLSSRPIPWRAGVAISLLQDSVELMLRQIASKSGIRVTEKMGFAELLDKLTQERPIPSHSQLHELNKARVTFKHYGILPAVEEGFRLGQYAESFLLWACDTYFNLDFRRISLASLVTNVELRSEIETAESCLQKASDADIGAEKDQNTKDAVLAVARALWVLRNRLRNNLPEVDTNLLHPPEFRDDHYDQATHDLFQYIGAYLGSLREFVLTLAQGVPNEYHRYLEMYLPATLRTLDRNYHYTFFHQKTKPSIDEVSRCVDIVIEMALGTGTQGEVDQPTDDCDTFFQ